MTILLIVESPAKCKKIEGFLGSGYKCVASFGHLRELDGLKSLDENFKPTFKNCDSKMAQIAKLKAAIDTSAEVILATDDDREGEGIAWHLCDLFGLSIANTKRIIFNEITKTAICSAVESPSRLDMNRVSAQQGRQVLDLLVGFKVSPVLWRNISKKKGLSAGRCQSPALRIIYENQQDIDNAPGVTSYNTFGYFTKLHLKFSLCTCFKSTEKMEDFLTESVNFDHKYRFDEPIQTFKQPPKPFTTSKIQQQANGEMRISPKETMSICQKLYEAGLITYMRTDSMKYSADFMESATKYIDKTWGSSYVGQAQAQGAQAQGAQAHGAQAHGAQAQEAHEAIRPTEIAVLEAPDTMTLKERKMYKLIWRNTIESCMTAAEYLTMHAVVSAFGGTNFKYTSDKNVFPGWKIVASVDDDKKSFDYLGSMTQGQDIDYRKIVSQFTLKELKTHYTEAKLVELLEKKGIGRPSTFSSLVEKIQDRGYVSRENIKGRTIECVNFELVDDELSASKERNEFGTEKNKLVITPVGVLVIEYLLKHFDTVMNYDFTREMEDKLDKISKGQHDYMQMCTEYDCELDKYIGRAENRIIDMPAQGLGIAGPDMAPCAGASASAAGASAAGASAAGASAAGASAAGPVRRFRFGK